MCRKEFEKNAQGFIIFDLNPKSPSFMQPTNGACAFDFLGYDISISTGTGNMLVEHDVIDPEGRRHMIRGSVQDAIMFVIQREQGRNNNAFVEALNERVEEV